MKGKVFGKILSVTLAAFMLFSVTACQNTGTQTNRNISTQASQNSGTQTQTTSGASNKPLLEYSVYYIMDSAAEYADVANDVVSKYILDKFNIKVSTVYTNEGMTKKQRLSLFIASGAMPDVIYDINDNITMPSTGLVEDLTDLIPQHCPNLLKQWPKEQWGNALYNGRLFCFPSVLINGSDEKYANDIFMTPYGNWAGIWTTESVLKKCGYSFTPSSQIIATVNSTQKKPTLADLAITPAIATPEDFYNFLRKIKEVYGDDVIPYDTWIALEPHLGTMFGLTCGQWTYDASTKSVYSSLGAPNAKAYWQFMNKLYTEGLLNKDFAIQKDEQRQEDIVNGKIKCWMVTTDANAVQKAVMEKDPSDSMRMLPLPQETGTTFPGIDVASAATFRFYINRNFSDIPRLLEFYDWTLTDEYHNLCNWGTEELGLYTTDSEGKRIFKDDSLRTALLNNDADTIKEKIFKFGLGGKSIISYGAPSGGYNTTGWQRSYGFTASVNDPSYLASFINSKGLNWSGTLLNGVNDSTNAASTWYNQVFEQQLSPKLFAAKSQADFNTAWESILKDFMKESDYENAQKEMAQLFATMGYDVASVSSTPSK